MVLHQRKTSVLGNKIIQLHVVRTIILTNPTSRCTLYQNSFIFKMKTAKSFPQFWWKWKEIWFLLSSPTLYYNTPSLGSPRQLLHSHILVTNQTNSPNVQSMTKVQNSYHVVQEKTESELPLQIKLFLFKSSTFSSSSFPYNIKLRHRHSFHPIIQCIFNS